MMKNSNKKENENYERHTRTKTTGTKNIDIKKYTGHHSKRILQNTHGDIFTEYFDNIAINNAEIQEVIQNEIKRLNAAS